ncbi:MAG: hypothetical protein ABIR18_13745 [Chitinophagaceae bacterium]
MKLSGTILFFILTFANYELFSQETKVNTTTLAYLEKFRADYTKTILDKNLRALEIYFSDNARLMPPYHKTVMGKNNVLIYYNAFLNHYDVKLYNRVETETLDLGSMIVAHGEFVMKLKEKTAIAEYELKGKYVDIWEKLPNGKLVLLTEGWNFDHNSEIEQKLRFNNEVPVADIAYQAHVPINNNISFELAALNSLMEATITRHDAKVWSQFYADDAIILTQRQPMVKGREEIDKYCEKHVKELPIFEKLDIRNDRIDDLGKYVIEYASHIAIIRDGDFSGVFAGKDLAIWRREPNGSLKIFRHIGMYD